MAKTKAAARKATLRTLAPFICAAQFEVMAGSSEFDALTEAVAITIAAMPVSYEQDGKGEEATAFLHYFNAGSDWYISEKDADGGVDQAFGLAILNGDTDNAELGYISIRELVASGVELDLLALFERLVAAALDVGVVDEDVVLLLTCDETEALFSIEELHSACCQRTLSSTCVAPCLTTTADSLGGPTAERPVGVRSSWFRPARRCGTTAASADRRS